MTDEDVSFMLTNKAGGFCTFSNHPKSRFEGVFFRKNDAVYKTIESIRLDKPVTKLVNQLWCASRERENLTETFFMPSNSSSVLYELSEKYEFDLILDCREIYDNREWGRNYDISKEMGCLIIKFTKRNEEKEQAGEEFDIYIAVYSNDLEYKPTAQWEKAYYELDKERDSLPFERHVFNACRVRCKEAVFAFANEKRKAMAEAKHVWSNRQKLKKKREAEVQKLIHRKKIKDDETAVAYQCSLNALNNLAVDSRGISAGLPWFYQFWARDELISLKALIDIGEFAFAKKILFHYLDKIGPEGKLPEKDINTKIRSADGVLWLFKRCEDFIEKLKEKRLTKKYLSKRDMKKIKDNLQKTISEWMKYHTENGLIVNEAQETWMDTDVSGDNRAGARIEMQALFLACLRLLRNIDKEDPFEKQLKKNVRQAFFNKRYLSDGADDKTIRPNIFIAAYVYPELLNREEWVKCFRFILPKLWLSWGGLSSIDKSNPLFQSLHTGEIPTSYHRGDSWFWINNITAVVLHRINKNKFKKYIDNILNASTQEMLYYGVTGYSAELSSAQELKSQGCFAQAWSSAMFIEMIHELY
jgi:glycogen debranching enzyme